jgi:ATP-dependent DNA helicase RecG
MLSTPLSKALRTTQHHLRRLKELNVETVEDFLMYFPHRYTDQREVKQIADVGGDEINTVRGVIKTIGVNNIWRRRMSITTVLLSDESGSIEAVWFNQPYVSRTLKKGEEIIVSGKVKYDAKRAKTTFQNPSFELVREKQIHTARIVPVYHETELNLKDNTPRMKGKISSKWIREKLFPLMPFADTFLEFLPPEIVKKYDLMALPAAIRSAHFPESEDDVEKAKRRLSFNELFLLQTAALYRKHWWRKIAAKEQKQIPPNWEIIKSFIESLPFTPTNAQKKAIYEIIKDLGEEYPMSRLLEGDTGSGKTVVAAAAVFHAVTSGMQACLIAPTEILARQHLKTFTKLLSKFEIKPILLVGSTPQKEKEFIKENLRSGKELFVIGTHALLQESISFKRLGLAVIDEQHRFGVRQREIIKSHGSPHVLNLTATPIPRTLALVLYADQELSVLDEMPAGRQTIMTRIVSEEKRAEAYKWIESEIERGRQAFFIFPLIQESPLLQTKAAVSEYELLKMEIFPKLKVGLLHGQMAALDKEEIMNEFAAGRIQILVSTAVVEVGVDVPNATIMMIEGAERFGLAQLHQFRGRVGRGSEKSYCLLFPSLQNPEILKRLRALEKHSSGFKLAEIDLSLRGPGEVYGTAQSGIPDLKMATLTDTKTIKESREAAEYIIQNDPEMNNYPELLKKVIEQENVAIDY